MLLLRGKLDIMELGLDLALERVNLDLVMDLYDMLA